MPDEIQRSIGIRKRTPSKADGGRPIAMLTMACQIKPGDNCLTYEYDSLTREPLIAKVDDLPGARLRWS